MILPSSHSAVASEMMPEKRPLRDTFDTVTTPLSSLPLEPVVESLVVKVEEEQVRSAVVVNHSLKEAVGGTLVAVVDLQGQGMKDQEEKQLEEPGDGTCILHHMLGSS